LNSVAFISQIKPLFIEFLVISNFFNMNLSKIFKNTILILMLSIFLNHCNFWRPVDARKVPTNAKERVQKNIEEGRTVRLSNLGKGMGGSGNFEFATSNEMWRATIDILDFVPLTSADYGGGIVITDWYASGDSNDSLKIMVQFLSNEIRADGIKVVVYNKVCKDDNSLNCQTEINQSSVGQELKLAILRKASAIKNKELKVKTDQYRKENPIINKDLRPN
jgi:type II secretory pathway component PulC